MRFSLRGVLMLLSVLLSGAAASAGDVSPRVLTDFASDAPLTWYTVNDGVMGGRSRGGFRTIEGVLVFSGSTNTRGGGFSSLRTRARLMDLTGYDGVRLRVKADGRRYTFRLTTAGTRRGRMVPSYWADFETSKNAGWEVVDVPFERFRPRWRGRLLSGPALDVSKIDSLGLMIYDKLDGPFRLEADWIQAYRTSPVFSMERFRWKRRPLLVFAPSNEDARLTRMLEDIGRTRARFDERDMVLIVVTPAASRAGEVSLSSADAKKLREAWAVPKNAFAVRLLGKDGGVKRSVADVPRLDDLYGLIDRMPMRKHEVSK